MKMRNVRYVLGVAFLGIWFPVNLPAQSISEEAQLQATQQEVEQYIANKGQQGFGEALAQQFQVPSQIVQDLRNAKQGWGEITIRLALAEQLMKTDSAKFPTMADALTRVGELRNGGMGWGRIAKELGLKLGPVISEARHTLQDLRREGAVQKAEKAGGKGDMKREAGLDQLNRLERPERAQRPDRLERPQRPDRVERPERPGR